MAAYKKALASEESISDFFVRETSVLSLHFNISPRVFLAVKPIPGCEDAYVVEDSCTTRPVSVGSKSISRR